MTGMTAEQTMCNENNHAVLAERVRAYVAAASEPRELIIVTELLRLGRLTCLSVGDEGFAARINASGVVLFAARTPQDAATVVQGLAEEVRASLAHGPSMFFDARDAEALGMGPSAMDCHLAVYEGLNPVPLKDTLRFEPLGLRDFEVVRARYDLLDEADLRRHLAESTVLGGYDAAGELVGFIGEHDEGSMGMLEVFPAYRRRGYGAELERAKMNELLAAGRVPYAQVEVTNTASLALQRKLGLTVLPGVQRWIAW